MKGKITLHNAFQTLDFRQKNKVQVGYSGIGGNASLYFPVKLFQQRKIKFSEAVVNARVQCWACVV